MLVPLIVIGVLFLITWIVIAIAKTPVSPEWDNFSPSRSYYDAIKKENEVLRDENLRLRSDLQNTYCSYRNAERLKQLINTPVMSPEELLKAFDIESPQPKSTYPPNEIKFDKHTYKLDKKEK